MTDTEKQEIIDAVISQLLSDGLDITGLNTAESLDGISTFPAVLTTTTGGVTTKAIVSVPISLLTQAVQDVIDDAVDATTDAQSAAAGWAAAAHKTKGDITIINGNITNLQNADKSLSSLTAYAECSTAANVSSKAVTVPFFSLPTNGGCLHVKMANANTAVSGVTLNINATGAKDLLYNGSAVSATNTWEDNEILEIYYDGTNYQATNAQGGGGSADRISFDNSQSGLSAENVQEAIDEVGEDVKLNKEFIEDLNGLLPTSQSTELTLISGKTISPSGNNAGNIIDSTGASYCSDYFPIDSDPTLVVKISGSIVTSGKRFYDSNKNYLSASYNSEARYFRFIYLSLLTENVVVTINGATAVLNKLDQIAGISDINQLSEEVGELRGDLNGLEQDIDNISEVLKNENYVKLVSGYIITGDYGILSPAENRAATESYIPISSEPSIALTVGTSTKTANKRYYDESKVYIGATYNSNAKFVRFWYDSAVIEDVTIKINDVLYSTTEEFKELASKDDLEELSESISDAVTEDELFDSKFVNMMNPANATFDRRYNGTLSSSSYGKIIAGYTYAGSGMIEVEEGKTYTISGSGFYGLGSESAQNVGCRGGYFGADATGAVGDTQIEAISFYNPAMGPGKCFTVPEGIGVKYVNFLMNVNGDRTAWGGNAMMNEGELALEYQEYQETKKIKEDLLPDGSGSGSGQSLDFLTIWLASPSGISYPDVATKLSNFRLHYMLKNKDLVVLNTGTSLTASSDQNQSVTTYNDAPYRPPLMQGKNYMSLLWNKLAWSNQYYRRYDAKAEVGGNDNMFTETGTFTTCTTYLSEWDLGGSFRPCYMRYADISSVNASVQFIVPAKANQFNFIHVTDQKGAQQCTIVVSEGNGYMEVWNGSAWVEANGYVFSERESAEVYLDSVSYINPSSGSNATINNYQVKGNFTYQKRLKMRSASAHISDEKHITITATQESNARFMYWGVEWSLRPYMITLINAARGSHNPLINNSSNMRELNHYQDNEVWSFKPDLIFTENPIINAGSSGPERAGYTTDYWARVTENFFFADNQVSMKARAKTIYGNDYAEGLEWVIFNTTASWHHSVTQDDTKQEICEKNVSGDYLTWLDANERAHLQLTTYHPEVVAINAAKYWRESALLIYGNVQDACNLSSAISTESFLKDGTHWNELGCKVMARVILPVLDFIK